MRLSLDMHCKHISMLTHTAHIHTNTHTMLWIWEARWDRDLSCSKERFGCSGSVRCRKLSKISCQIQISVSVRGSDKRDQHKEARLTTYWNYATMTIAWSFMKINMISIDSLTLSSYLQVRSAEAFLCSPERAKSQIDSLACFSSPTMSCTVYDFKLLLKWWSVMFAGHWAPTLCIYLYIYISQDNSVGCAKKWKCHQSSAF